MSEQLPKVAIKGILVDLLLKERNIRGLRAADIGFNSDGSFFLKLPGFLHPEPLPDDLDDLIKAFSDFRRAVSWGLHLHLGWSAVEMMGYGGVILANAANLASKFPNAFIYMPKDLKLHVGTCLNPGQLLYTTVGGVQTEQWLPPRWENLSKTSNVRMDFRHPAWEKSQSVMIPANADWLK